ncbi:MAG: hypothetical protein IPM95_14235 [Sphingobacteriales bacterium]|nr:hypothetical protein [Sphingobacteriales bacterium]
MTKVKKLATKIMIYTPKLNLIIPLLRSIFLVLLIGCIIIIYAPIKKTIENKDIGAFFYIGFFLISFIILSWQMIKGILTEALIVSFTPNEIVIRNIATFNKEVIEREQLKGIYGCKKQFAKGSFDSIIIESKNRKRIELIEFNYFAFKSIISEIEKLGYKKTGTIFRNTSLFKNTEYTIE